MNQDLKILRAVAIQADLFYEEAKRFGDLAAGAFRRDARAQITGLESIANSALKVSDVLDYLKIRTARCRPGEKWGSQNLGRDLIGQLDEQLKRVRDKVCAVLEPPVEKASAKAQEIYLLLIREFIRQLAAHYEFTAAEGGTRGNQP